MGRGVVLRRCWRDWVTWVRRCAAFRARFAALVKGREGRVVRTAWVSWRVLGPLRRSLYAGARGAFLAWGQWCAAGRGAVVEARARGEVVREWMQGRRVREVWGCYDATGPSNGLWLFTSRALSSSNSSSSRSSSR